MENGNGKKEDLNAIIEKVKKLLNFNPQNATENEVVLATQMAQNILLKYQLTMADLELGKSGEDIIEEIIDPGTVAKTCHYALIRALTDAFDCQYILTRKYTTRRKSWNFRVIGHKSDVEVVKYFYSYLYNTLLKMAQIQGRQRGFTGGYLHSYYNSFIQAAAGIINSRLTESREAQKASVEVTAKKSTALVVVKNTEVKKYMKDTFGKLKSVNINFSNNSAYGQVDGAAAGRKVSLNRGVGGRQGNLSLKQ